MANFCVVFMFVFSLSVFITTPTFSQTNSCKFMKFTNKMTFDNCINLPTLTANLHYTYDPKLSTLSTAYTAIPPSSDGWVAWALNPKAMGMVGAQSLIAYKPDPSSAISVKTLNIVSYDNIIDGPISYNVTGLSSEETNGAVTIFGTWVIPRGEKSVNIVWQVGPIVSGKPGVHSFAPANLQATMKLSLPVVVVQGPSGSPTVSPIGAPTSGKFMVPASSPEGKDNAPSPAQKSGGARKSVVSMVMVLVALLFCLF